MLKLSPASSQRHVLRVALATATVGLLSVALSPSSRAVVVANPNSTITLSAPAGFPGWSNMAYLNDGGAVYLGDRWVITAAHVGQGAVRFTDGRVFQPAIGSAVELVNPSSTGLGGSPDLLMFQLTADPGLPSLNIASKLPKNGTTLTMMGAGLDRAPNLIGWQVSSVNGVETWKQAPLPLDNVRGYSLLDTSQMRWGRSQIIGTTSYSANNGSNPTPEFITQFSSLGGPFQAQAVAGDSGGGVFQTVNGHSTLAGIIDAQTFPLPNQPSNVVVFGQTTYSVDLSVFRDQILNIVDAKVPLDQNQVNHFDVNGSGTVSASDYLALLNEVASLPNGSMKVTASFGPHGPFYDVNGDGVIDSQDLVAESLYLTQVGLSPFIATPSLAPAAFASQVPEPASVVLACGGLLALLAARYGAIARRKRALKA